MSVILKVDTEDGANFRHEGGGAGGLVIAVVIITGVNFVELAGITGAGNLKIAR